MCETADYNKTTAWHRQTEYSRLKSTFCVAEAAILKHLNRGDKINSKKKTLCQVYKTVLWLHYEVKTEPTDQ